MVFFKFTVYRLNKLKVRRNCSIEHLMRFINLFILFTVTNASVSLNYLFFTHGKHYGNKYDLVTVSLVTFLCISSSFALKQTNAHTLTFIFQSKFFYPSLFICKTNIPKWHWNKAMEQSSCLKATWIVTININLHIDSI